MTKRPAPFETLELFIARTLRGSSSHGGALRLFVLCSMTLSAFALISPAAQGTDIRLDQIDPGRVQWHQVEFRAKKLGFSADTGIEFTTVSAAEAGRELVEMSEGTGLAPSSDVLLMTVSSKGLGRDSRTRLWIDPEDTAAYQREQVDSGKKARYRAVRFSDRGVATTTRRPNSGEETKDNQQWTNASAGYAAFPHWAGTDLTVAESLSVFYVLSAAPFEKQGDRVQVPTFSKNNLLLLELTLMGRQKVKVDYIEQSGSAERRVKGSVEALEILVDAKHLDPDSNEAHMEFMGLGGDITILLDPTTRVPLEVSGKVKVAGNVKIRLQRAVLN